jgi:hypothetical protein
MNLSLANIQISTNIDLQNNQQPAENICSYKKKSSSNPKEHPYTVDSDTKSFDFKSQLNNNISIHKNKKSYMCNICNKGFTRVDNLNRHYKIKSHITRENKPLNHKKYNCNICIQGFDKKVKLVTHYSKDHQSDRHFKCYVCDKTYVNEAVMKAHYRKKHGVKQIKNYECDLCDHVVDTSKQLRIHHKQQHPSKRPFVCKICHSDYLSLSAKNKHNRIKHTDNTTPSIVPSIVPNNRELEDIETYTIIRVNQILSYNEQYHEINDTDKKTSYQNDYQDNNNFDPLQLSNGATPNIALDIENDTISCVQQILKEGCSV